jgi:hypothetical protein
MEHTDLVHAVATGLTLAIKEASFENATEMVIELTKLDGADEEILSNMLVEMETGPSGLPRRYPNGEPLPYTTSKKRHLRLISGT